MHVFIYIYLHMPTTSTSPLPMSPRPRAPAHLIHMVKGGALIWPVAVTLLDAILHQWGQHNDDGAATLPHHLGTDTGGVSSTVTSWALG